MKFSYIGKETEFAEVQKWAECVDLLFRLSCIIINEMTKYYDIQRMQYNISIMELFCASTHVLKSYNVTIIQNMKNKKQTEFTVERGSIIEKHTSFMCCYFAAIIVTDVEKNLVLKSLMKSIMQLEVFAFMRCIDFEKLRLQMLLELNWNIPWRTEYYKIDYRDLTSIKGLSAIAIQSLLPPPHMFLAEESVEKSSLLQYIKSKLKELGSMELSLVTMNILPMMNVITRKVDPPVVLEDNSVNCCYKNRMNMNDVLGYWSDG